jgi:hypothetical protein
MTLLAISPGSPLLTGPNARALIAALPPGSTQPAGVFTGPYPSAIAGLSGWWDAGLLSGLRDENGAPVAVVNSVVGSVADKSGNNKALTPYHYAVVGTPASALAAPRVNGYLGGIGAPDPAIVNYGPSLDPDWGLSHPGFELGAASAWTRYFVWTRPNLRQGTYYVNAAPIPLIHCTAPGATILQADTTDSNLTLFPGTPSQFVLSTVLARRHTHAVILRNTPGIGVDVWLDGVRVATAVTNPLGASANAQVLLLHDGTLQGSAQCWFHEAANWERALSGAEISTLIACQSRWVLGARRGVSLLVMGQSNAAWFIQSGGLLAMSQGIAWYLGAASYSLTYAFAGGYLSPARYTVISGHPISNSTPPPSITQPGVGNGTFLTNPGDGSDPSTWSAGPDFAAVTAYLTGASAVVSAADAADIAFIIWPWSEQDSMMPYADKALYKGTVLRLLSLTRGVLGRSAASLPLLAWNAIPYETNDGVQMVRESIADLAAEPANNIIVFAAQTADSNPLNSSYDPSTGLFSGGDHAHRDEPDLLRYGRIGAFAAGRAAIAQGLCDTIPATALPSSGLPAKGGPKITNVYRASDRNIILTIEHDSGNDLLVPLQAANGAGFAVMDGGSVASPGNIISATAAVRVDATHVSVTLESPITNPSSNAFFFYPYGSTQIGRGDAVTDNASLLTPPTNWDIANDLGSAWAINMPLQATFYPIALSNSP